MANSKNIKKGGLGRGLGALLTQTAAQYNNTSDTVVDVEVDKIVPNRYQPRRNFDAGALAELADSIRAYGILQPLIVRKIDSGYELIAGERRLRASKIVGLVKVPAIIREYTDAQMSEISIIENVQRENLNVIEEAQAYERLIKEFGHTQEVVAVKIGRSRSHISNILRLLKLTPEVRHLVANNILTLGQARPLLAIENPVIQVQAAEMILSEGLSVRKVEAFINELKNSGLLASMTENMRAVKGEKVDSAVKSSEVDSSSLGKGFYFSPAAGGDSAGAGLNDFSSAAGANSVGAGLNDISSEAGANSVGAGLNDISSAAGNGSAGAGLDDISSAAGSDSAGAAPNNFSPPANDIHIDNEKSRDKINNIIIPETKSEDTSKTKSETKSDVKIPDRTPVKNVYLADAEARLARILGAKVKISANKKFGRIQIDFASESELNRIVDCFDQSVVLNTYKPEPAPPMSKEEKIAALRNFSTKNFNI